MKFAVAVVMLVLAVGAQASSVAWPGALGLWGGPSPYSLLPAAVDIHAPYGPYGPYGPYPVAGHGYYGTPGISLSQGYGPGAPWAPAAYAAPVPAAHGHEGVYVAKTRGAIHTAPLAGHLQSATSINVAPAPGTH